MKKINVGIVGVGPFARPFIRCYQRHPGVDKVAICATSKQSADEKGEMLGIPEELRYTDYDEMLANPEIDAIHIITPTFVHYEHEMKALAAGKCVAIAVSMAETIDQLKDIVRMRRKMGKTFMLMETSAYSRDMLKAKKLVESGQLGKVQFIMGSHTQNTNLLHMDARWNGYPPMLYGSHACVPLYALTGKLASSVTCLGSGDIGPEWTGLYGCKDAVQVTLVSLKDSDVVGCIYRTMAYAIRQFREHFDVFGSKMSYEYAQVIGEGAAIQDADGEAHRELAEDVTDGLPDSLIYKGEKTDYTGWFDMPVDSEEYALRLGHYGSYPHLIHEFVTACCEERDSALDVEIAANITAIGILAVESAAKGGQRLEVPDFYQI